MAFIKSMTGEVNSFIDKKITEYNKSVTKEFKSINSTISTLIDENVAVINFKSGNPLTTKLSIGLVRDITNTFDEPGISFGVGDGAGGNRGYITKDTNSLNLYYVGNLALGEVAGLAIYKNKIETTVNSLTFNKNLGSEFIVDATNWSNKLYEADAKAILENGAKNWEIPKANLKGTDVAYWDAGGSQNGLALSYYNLMNTDLGKNAALPTSITMGSFGIKATATGGASYAQLDYRGLYINNGAIQIQNSSGSTVLDSTGIYADYIIGSTLSTYNWSGGSNYYISMTKQLQVFKESSVIKMAQGFVLDNSGTLVPGIVLGAGAGNDSSIAKGFITKDTVGLNLYYVSSANSAQGISIKADGIYCTSELKLSTTLSQTYLTQAAGWVNNLTQKLNSSGNFGVNQTGVKRVELTSTIVSKNSSGQKNGLYVDPTYSDLILYYNDIEHLKLYNELNGTSSLYIQTNRIGYGSSTSFTPTGTWNFASATITGLTSVWG